MADGLSLTQDGRLLTFASPLGADKLILTGFSGNEQLSGLFSFHLELISGDPDINPETLLGKGVSWSVKQPDGDHRYFHGIVGRFGASATQDGDYRWYSAEIFPKFWLLTHAANSRIFQQKSIPEIIKKVLGDFDIVYDASGIAGTHAAREYCVQYRETDFAFLTRLMEEEGIYYSFTYSEDDHTLVLADSSAGYTTCPDSPIEYAANSDARAHVASWEQRQQFRTGKWTQRDYNFETPTASLEATILTALQVPDFKKFEYFDYPGGYKTAGDGSTVTRLRMEEEEAGYTEVDGTGTCTAFIPCAKFAISGHDLPGKVTNFVLTHVSHHASDMTQIPGHGGESDYHNSFTCIPSTVTFRPPRLTPRPVMRGLQTAIVTGPSGEEIYCDKYGRIKIQFPWDREGKKDDTSSCYVRVIQLMAGPQWGTQFIPRIGMEVLVDFLEGDPDRPIVIGCAYNAVNMPTYTLPDQKTQSGIKTRSSIGGGASNANELRFEDKKGSEEVVFHAEKDFLRSVENDDSLTVGHDQTIEIKNDRTETVKEGNETITIEQGNRTVTLKTGNDALTLKQGNRSVTLDAGNDELMVKQGNMSVKVSLGSATHEAMQSIELKVGSSSLKIDPSSITLNAMTINISGQLQTQISGMMTEVSGSAMTQISGGLITIG